jgi:hypothetical protein
MILWQSLLDDLDEKKRKSKKVTGHMQNRSVVIIFTPGGSLLLPILIKFIPKLLPSAFNENLDIE